MVARAARGMLEQLVARDTLARLVDDVAPTGARVMPLKGILLVALGIRSASERPMIDVDVLVDPDRARAAVAAVRARGWEVRLGNATACMLVHPRTSSTSVDLHRALFPPHTYRMAAEAVLARGTPDVRLFGRQISRMSGLDLYAHLVGHFTKGRSDGRDLRLLRDFAPAGRASGATPAEHARHLEALGLGRAARYALGLAVERERDGFAAEVLAALRPDRRGQILARVARRALARVTPGSQWGIPFVHSLNATLGQGARSLAANLTDPIRRGGPPEAWWRP